MKKIISTLLASIMVLSLAACGGTTPASSTAPDVAKPADSSTAAPSAPKETVTLRMWGGVPPEAGPQEVIDNFNAAFKDKGIQAEYERFVNDETGNLKLDTSLLAGGEIDLYMTYTTPYLTKRAEGNMALDLTELAARDGFDVEKSFGPMAKAFYIGGKPYSVPTKLDQYGMVLNKDMFDAAGIPIPTDWTFDEFREIAKKLTKGEGDSKVYGVYWNTNMDMYQLPTWLTAQTFGGDPFYADGGKSTNFTAPDFIKAIELINNTMNIDGSAMSHVDSVTQKLSQESTFLTGKTAMLIGPWVVRSIKDKEKYPHDFVTAFAPYPVVSKDKRNFSQGGFGDHLCINPKSANVEAAWEFAKWYATEGMLPVVKGGRVPAYSGFAADVVTKTYLSGAEELFDEASTKSVIITPKPNHAVPSIYTKLPEINKVFSEESEAIYTGKKTVEQGMADAKKRADEFLK